MPTKISDRMDATRGGKGGREVVGSSLIESPEVDPSDASSLLADLRTRTRELFTLLRSAGELGKDATGAFEKAAREIEERLAREEHRVLILGEAAHRRAFVDALLGEPVLAAVQREAKATMCLRWRAVADYEAKLRGGIVERFQESVPEREEAFAKAIARAERDWVAAEEEARVLAAEIEAEERSAKTILIETTTFAERLLALWARFVAWLFGSFSRGALPIASSGARAGSSSGTSSGAPPEEPPSLRARAHEAADRAAKATARQATLEGERALYAVERRKSFFAALRALTDDLSRGGEVTELTIDVPSSDLPSGITLVSASELRAYDDVEGCLFVTDGAPGTRDRFAAPLATFAPIATRSVAPGARGSDVRRAIGEIAQMAPLAAGQRAVSLARSTIGSAFEDGARAEAVCHARIAALEGQRLTDPAEFRARSMARMEKAIDDGAGEVLRAALARQSPRNDALKAEWQEALLACADRAAVEACVLSIR